MIDCRNKDVIFIRGVDIEIYIYIYIYIYLNKPLAFAFTIHLFGMWKPLWQKTQTREVLMLSAMLNDLSRGRMSFKTVNFLR